MSRLRHVRPGSPTPLATTAAAWVLRAEQGLSAGEQRALDSWLEQPAHRAAFEDAIWALDAVQAHAAEPDLLALREAALAKRGRARRWPRLTAAALAAAAVCGLFLLAPQGRDLLSTPRPPPQLEETARGGSAATPGNGTYRTGVGERSAIVLPDGSIATLDTSSEIAVAYSATRRGLVLQRGQAFFEVARGRSRPFEVLAAGQRIKAVGTRFNVRVDGSRVEVAMVEGIVEVADRKSGSAGPTRALTLRAGERLSSGPGEAVRVRPVEGEIAAWRGGLLVFEDETLRDAVAEINRYSAKPIRIADPAIGDYRVTGVFSTNDPERFATAMTEVFPIGLVRMEDGTPVLAARP